MPWEQSMQDKVLLKIGAVSAIVGALATIVFSLLHPPLPSDPEAILGLIASHKNWGIVHLGIILAAVLLLGGFVALADSMSAGKDRSLSLIGFGLALLGAGILIIGMAIDGFATKTMADAWAIAPAAEKAQAMQVAYALERVQTALFYISISIFLGATFILYGLAVVFSPDYPRWLGWVIVVSGTGCLIVGLSGFLKSETDLGIIFRIFALVESLWMLIMGLLMWRRALP
jgi:hypothetical protein